MLVPPGSSGCAVSSKVNVPGGVSLKGYNQRGSFLLAGTTNMSPMIQLQGDGSTVSDLTIKASNAGVNTSGATVAYAFAGYERVDRVLILGPCIGLDIIGNNVAADGDTINDVNGSGCYAIRVGHTTTNGNTADVRLSNISAGGSVTTASTAALFIEDAGGLYATNLDLLFSVDGTLIKPGANQVVQWAFFSNTVLGDTNVNHGLHIDTASASGIVEGVSCQGCWVGTSKTSGIEVDNTAGGTITGLHFSNLRIYTTINNGVDIYAGSDITFDNSWFCGIPNSKSVIYLGSGISRGAIRNSTLGNCDNSSPVTAGFGIVFVGSNSDMIVSGNDLTGATAAIQGAPTGSSVMTDNKGVDTHVGPIASAATISPTVFPILQLTGTTAITTINNAWIGRHITFISTTGAVPFNTGGNICNSLTSTVNVPVEAYYNGTCWNLK